MSIPIYSSVPRSASAAPLQIHRLAGETTARALLSHAHLVFALILIMAASGRIAIDVLDYEAQNDSELVLAPRSVHELRHLSDEAGWAIPFQPDALDASSTRGLIPLADLPEDTLFDLLRQPLTRGLPAPAGFNLTFPSVLGDWLQPQASGSGGYPADQPWPHHRALGRDATAGAVEQGRERQSDVHCGTLMQPPAGAWLVCRHEDSPPCGVISWRLKRLPDERHVRAAMGLPDRVLTQRRSGKRIDSDNGPAAGPADVSIAASGSAAQNRPPNAADQAPARPRRCANAARRSAAASSVASRLAMHNLTTESAGGSA